MISKQTFNKNLFVFFVLAQVLFATKTFAQTPQIQVPPNANPECAKYAIVNGNSVTFPQCCDGIDNDGDGRADFYGTTLLPSDPKCLYPGDTESETTPVTSKIVPCTDKCDLQSVFQLVNNIISFFFTYLLIPIFIIILMYSGWQYLAAQVNPGKKADLLKTLRHIILGLILILTAWLIVKTILTLIIDPSIQQSVLQFFQ